MIHRFKMGGKNIVMDINSGAVHVTDDCLYDILSVLGDDTFEPEDNCPSDITASLSGCYSEKEIEDAYGEIKELVQEGLLYTIDTYADMAKNWNKKSYIKAMCLHVCLLYTSSFGKPAIIFRNTIM